MRAFTALYVALENEKRPLARLRALVNYYRQAPGADAAWATYLLRGGGLPRTANAAMVGSAARAASGVPEWLFRMAHQVVGDLAETAAAVLPDPAGELSPSLATCLEEWLAPLALLPPEARRARLAHLLATLGRHERYVLAKLAEGRLRRVTGPPLVVAALAEVTGLPAATVTHHLQEPWRPTSTFWSDLAGAAQPLHRALPFRPIVPLEGALEQLGEPTAWHAEWQYPGTRVQLVVRPGGVGVWSDDGELLTDRYPGVVVAGQTLLSNTVLDGTLVAEAVRASGPGDRHGAAHATLFVHDALEIGGEDLRTRSLARRRARLAEVVAAHGVLRPAEGVPVPDWTAAAAARTEARRRGAAGLLLRHRDDPYDLSSGGGHAWWLARVEPHRVRALLLYLQLAPGASGHLVLDCTFGAPSADGPLVVAKSPTTPLTATEVHALDRWARRHTLEKFGPVRHVQPVQVFDLAIDDIRPSRRHKSGVVLRGVRIVAWLRGADATMATPLEDLRALAASGAPHAR